MGQKTGPNLDQIFFALIGKGKLEYSYSLYSFQTIWIKNLKKKLKVVINYDIIML